jgi:hypothetical protein
MEGQNKSLRAPSNQKGVQTKEETLWTHETPATGAIYYDNPVQGKPPSQLAGNTKLRLERGIHIGQYVWFSAASGEIGYISPDAVIALRSGQVKGICN